MQDIDSIFKKQQQNRWKISQTSANQRQEKLLKLKDGITEHQKELQEAIYLDFKKNPSEVDITEIYPIMSEIKYAIKNISKWMKPKRVKTPLSLFGTKSFVQYEARGVVLILSPWNYPFQLLIGPMIGAIAAGNCAMLKSSSKVPNTASFIHKLISKLFDENEIAFIEGNSSISNKLLELPFDHICFTGSPRIGKVVMNAAAKHLSTVTLELGGKSPIIVDKSANLQKVAERLSWGKFINAGQTCVAPDYLLVEKNQEQKLIQLIKKTINQRYGQQIENSQDFCRIISKDHHSGLQEVLQKTLDEGATLEFGGEANHETKYLGPTIISNVTKNMEIMKEEIFGPILPIMTFDHIDEAISIIQSKEKPLALYIFSNNKQNINKVLSSTSAGGTCINHLIVHLANHSLPFGGVGNSGMGNYHGYFGFKTFSHERAVLRQTKIFDSVKLFYPPYNNRVKKLIQLAIKYL